jgi:hypothetical protein
MSKIDLRLAIYDAALKRMSGPDIIRSLAADATPAEIIAELAELTRLNLLQPVYGGFIRGMESTAGGMPIGHKGPKTVNTWSSRRGGSAKRTE